MTAEVISVQPQTTIQNFGTLLEKTGVSVMPVVNPDNTLFGIISSTDLIESDRPLHIPTVVSIFDWVLYLESEKNFTDQVKKITARTVGEVCTRKVVTCAPDTHASEVAELMVKHKVHLIPVLEAGKLVGVVGRLDIVRSMSGNFSAGVDA
jgi:CBS domain-containing protein